MSLASHVLNEIGQYFNVLENDLSKLQLYVSAFVCIDDSITVTNVTLFHIGNKNLLMLGTVFARPLSEITIPGYRDTSVSAVGREMCSFIVDTGAEVFTLCNKALTNTLAPHEDRNYTVVDHHGTFLPSPVIKFLLNDQSTPTRSRYINPHKSEDTDEYYIDKVVNELSIMNVGQKIHQVSSCNIQSMLFHCVQCSSVLYSILIFLFLDFNHTLHRSFQFHNSVHVDCLFRANFDENGQ